MTRPLPFTVLDNLRISPRVTRQAAPTREVQPRCRIRTCERPFVVGGNMPGRALVRRGKSAGRRCLVSLV